MNPISLLYNTINNGNGNVLWRGEHHDLYASLDVNGGSSFAESLDSYRTSWFVKYFEKIAPYQKNIIIDHKDLDLFHALYK